MTHAQRSSRVFWRLVEESVSEADYLWARLDAALDSHQYTLPGVHTWVEDRLLGALDGIRLAGSDAIEPLLVPALQAAEPGMVGMAACVLSQLASASADRALEDGLRQVTVEAAPAFARGLGRAAQVDALHALWTRLHDASPTARAVVLEALAFCGEAPEADWAGLLVQEDSGLRMAAAAALRFASAGQLTAVLDLALFSSDAALRNRAIFSGVAAGHGQSWQHCSALARSRDEQTGPLLPLVAALGGDRERQLVLSALSTPALARDALWALGFMGTTEAAEACLVQLTAAHPQHAAEAFCAITGLDLAREHLIAAPLEKARENESDDELADLGPGAHDGLPLPNVEGVQTWWGRQRSRFLSGQRYVAGRSASLVSLREALAHVSTRRRHTIALELSARSLGACMLQPLAFTRVQQTQLKQLAAVPPATLHHASRTVGFAPLAAV